MAMETWLLSLVAVLINFANAVSPPTINIIPVHNLAPHWRTTFTLHCAASGWPGQPIFFWKRDGGTLYPYDDPSITFSSDKQSLIFENVLKPQSGNFTCIAAEFREYIFETSRNIEISVQEPPHIPRDLQMVSKTSDSFAFQWNGVEDVDRYLVRQQPGDITHTTSYTNILIPDLSPYTIYEFSVRAENSVGDRGYSDIVQIRTDASEPSGVLDFAIGVRTATTIQVLWAAPPSGVLNGKLMGYSLQIYDATETMLQEHNYTTNTTQTIISNLVPETPYQIKMTFTTNCCASAPESKRGATVAEGTTVAPSVVPVTERNTALLSQASMIGIISAAALVLLLLSLLGVVCYKRRTNVDKSLTWNDGTVPGSLERDLMPISPPPQYTQHDPHVDDNTDVSSHVNNPSISNSFCFNNVTPPPAYHSRSSSNNNSSISSLSNVGTLLPDEDKEQNCSPSPRRLLPASLLPHSSSPPHSSPPRASPPRPPSSSPPRETGVRRDTWI